MFEYPEPSEGKKADEPLIRLKNISKSFGTLKALDDVSMDFYSGEIHVLLGENGAGKSTLMNILAGVYSAESGSLKVNGTNRLINSPQDAAKLGIGIVHQNFRLVKRFTGRENIRLQTNHLIEYRSQKKFEERLRATLKLTNLSVNLEVPIQDLSIAEQQRIEILKALFLGAKILILDEPTAVLTDNEALEIIRLMKSLSKSGKSIVFISHKLREVTMAGGVISILRSGKLVLGPQKVSDLTSADMSKAIVGSSNILPSNHRKINFGCDLLELKKVSLNNVAKVVLNNVSFRLRAGEIVGIAGVGGNGQKELAEVIVGLKKPDSGRVEIFSQDASTFSIKSRRRHGLRYIPADRNSEALALNCTCNENLVASDYANNVALFKWNSKIQQNKLAFEKIKKINVKGQNKLGSQPVKYLSGGNLQKVVVGREMDEQAKILLFHSPTQGLDIAAQRSVWNSIIDAANNLAAVLIISEDLEEVFALSDKILVMSSGRVLHADVDLPPREKIGRMMLGNV